MPISLQTCRGHTWHFILSWLLLFPCAGHSNDRERELLSLIKASCASPAYLDCMKSDRNRCNAQLPIVAKPCVEISFIASPAEAPSEDVRRALLKCIIAAHSDFAGLLVAEFAQCLAEDSD